MSKLEIAQLIIFALMCIGIFLYLSKGGKIHVKHYSFHSHSSYSTISGSDALDNEKGNETSQEGLSVLV